MMYHMCISVCEMLNWTQSETRRNLKNITKNDGTKYKSLGEFRDDLITELSRGHEVMKLGECDNFDYKKGCLGHPEDAPEVE